MSKPTRFDRLHCENRAINTRLPWSKSKVPELEVYIANQAEHHLQISFADEYIGLLKRHEIDFDERFVLD